MIKAINLSILLLCLHTLQAQEIYLRNFTIDDGLPSNEIYQVIQDDFGNLLAATDRGVVRFDGYSFENVKLNNEQSSSPVYYIYKAPQGKIFFSGLKGYIYEYKDHTLFNSPFNHKTASLFKHPGIFIANTLSLQRDSLWVSYNNDFSFNFNVGSIVITPKGEIKRLIRQNGIYFDFPHNFFYRQLSDTTFKNNVQPVFITWKDGIVTRDSISLSWQSGYIRRLYSEHVAGYELFCIGRILLIYKDRKRIGTFTVPENILTVAIIDNQVWLGFQNGGVAVYQINNGNIKGPVRHYLKNLTVTCIFQDKQGGIWFSTQENGLYYSYPSVAKYWESENNIVAIEKNKNQVYVGYRSGTIQIFTQGSLVQKLKLPDVNTDMYNLSFYKDSLIVITGKGYFVHQNTTWKFYPAYNIQLLAVGSNIVYAAAAAYAELYIYEGHGGKLFQRIALPKRIISMLYDGQQQLWLGTWEGLYKYSGGSMINLTALNPVFKDRITAIKALPGNVLAISSLSNGLAIYQDNKSYILNMGNGLITPLINSMEVDGDTIWLGTNKGLTRVLFKDQKFIVHHFGLEAGLPTLDINKFTISNGQLYLKWVQRLVTLSLGRSVYNTIPESVRITSVLVNDQRADTLGRSLYNYKQNEFRFNFSSVNLAGANQQEYHYILEGYDDKWNRTRERYAKYTNLSPGNYSFKVQAIGTLRGESTDLAVYSFTIVPAVWQQWWFPVMTIALLLILAYVIFRIRIASIKKKNQLLLDLAESKQKVLVQLINPHFIFNILNTVQGAILKQDKIKAASIISRFAKVMRLSMELSKQKLVSLQSEINFLEKYFELESIRSPDKISYKIEVESSVSAADLFIPSMLIQPFVENAIKHGISHLPDKTGFVFIKFQYINNQLLCITDDNGIGRQRSEAINKNMQSEYPSSGLEITLNRLKLLHKEGGTEFIYEVKDKLNSMGEPQGTTVVFALPFKIKL